MPSETEQNFRIKLPIRLFLDGRVTFETRSYCAVEKDNIYTVGYPADDPKGILPTLNSVPMSETDSLLFHDPLAFGSLER